MQAPMTAYQPLVSVVTPVYNGADYLAECIESVLCQSYGNFEYVIVNNRSTDASLAIARSYAERDRRIRVLDNTEFVGVIENHNIAFRAISPESRYCKVVSADDWIYPECVEKMVALAQGHPSIGIVACYTINDRSVHTVKLPLKTDFLPGREAGRRQLLDQALFKPPSGLLYRSDLVRKFEHFLPGTAPSADMEGFFRDMQHHDYGCVHQILCYERIHDRSITSTLTRFNSLLVDRLEFLARYGSFYLSEGECRERSSLLAREYYEFLADRALHLAGHEFWQYQSGRLASFGAKIEKPALRRAVLRKIADLVLDPRRSLEKIFRRLKK